MLQALTASSISVLHAPMHAKESPLLNASEHVELILEIAFVQSTVNDKTTVHKIGT